MISEKWSDSTEICGKKKRRVFQMGLKKFNSEIEDDWEIKEKVNKKVVDTITSMMNISLKS